MQSPNSAALSMLDILQQPEYTAHPYAFYHRLRSLDPVYWDERQGNWVLTRYQDVASLLRDPRVTAVRPPTGSPEEKAGEIVTSVDRVMTSRMSYLDPPDHTRLRSLVSKSFIPRQVETWRPMIQQVVDSLFDVLLPRGRMEVISDFAYPLSITIIARMLGVPVEDGPQLVKWANGFGVLLDTRNATVEKVTQARSSLIELMDYFRSHIRARHNAPQNDILQIMTDAGEQNDRLSEDELLGNCIQLLAAGHGTTTHLIGNGLLALLHAPEQWQLLRTQPELIPMAVQEFLRFESSLQITWRMAKEDLQLGDKQIKAGQKIEFVLGAANHDPEQFRDPDQLKVDREENRHLAFGLGVHFCLGAPMARLEAEVAFASLIQQLHEPQLATEHIEHEPNLTLRFMKALPVTFSPRAS